MKKVNNFKLFFAQQSKKTVLCNFAKHRLKFFIASKACASRAA